MSQRVVEVVTEVVEVMTEVVEVVEVVTEVVEVVVVGGAQLGPLPGGNASQQLAQFAAPGVPPLAVHAASSILILHRPWTKHGTAPGCMPQVDLVAHLVTLNLQPLGRLGFVPLDNSLATPATHFTYVRLWRNMAQLQLDSASSRAASLLDPSGSPATHGATGSAGVVGRTVAKITNAAKADAKRARFIDGSYFRAPGKSAERG